MLSLITDNITFFLIGLVVILIVIIAYVFFIVPRPYKQRKSNEDKTIEKQDKSTSEQKDYMGALIDQKRNIPKQEQTDGLKTDDYVQAEDEKEEIVDDEPVSPTESIEDIDTEEKLQDSDQVKTMDTLDEADEALKASDDEASLEEDQEEKKEDKEEPPVELGKYHVLYRDKDKKWYVKREGSERTLRVLYTKKEAIAYATIKAINQDTNIVIHGKDGKIERHGY